MLTGSQRCEHDARKLTINERLDDISDAVNAIKKAVRGGHIVSVSDVDTISSLVSSLRHNTEMYNNELCR